MTKVANHRYQHKDVERYNNNIFIVKLLVAKKVFEEILDSGLLNSD